MGFKTLGELRAYLAARALKLEVYRLVKAHPTAYNDHRFRSQLFEAAASVEINIAEGFRRYSAGEFAHFLKISRGSLEETTGLIISLRQFTSPRKPSAGRPEDDDHPHPRRPRRN